MDMARKELAAHEIHEALIVEDIREAADELKETFERTGARWLRQPGGLATFCSRRGCDLLGSQAARGAGE